MIYRLFGILLLTFSPVTLFASDIMFEGYYKVELEAKQIGYIITRFAFDPKTSNFEATEFTRYKIGESVFQVSVKAKATDKFHPISFQYTSQDGDQVKIIDATIKGEIMTAKISDGKKLRNETSKVPKGTFLSSFLPYMLMLQKLELNEAFKYSAIAEEDAGSYNGKAFLQARESKPGMDTYTILNKFKGEEFISKMAIVKDAKTQKNVKGEVLSTSVPAKNLTTKLMPSASQATEGQLVPNKTLMTAFGDIPTGKVNVIATPPSVEISNTKKAEKTSEN